MQTIGHAPAHYGPIHGDLSFENVLVAGGATIVIDFDDCGDGWFARELAVGSHPTRAAATSTPAETLSSAVTGVSSPPDELLAELPTFMMARRLCTLGWLFSRARRRSTPPLSASGDCSRPRLLCVRFSPG